MTEIINSLLLVVAAAVHDRTYCEVYLEVNPLRRMTIQKFGYFKITPDDLICHNKECRDVKRINQTYTVIMQVLDDDGIARPTTWQEGMLG